MMNDAPHTEDASDFPNLKAALCLGTGLLIVLFAVLAPAWRDNGRRLELENTTRLTAAGDTHYFPMPTAVPPPYASVASLAGQPLFPVDFRRREYQPDDLKRVGVDEKGGYILYRAPVRAKDADEQKDGPLYLLKISPTEYLKVRPGKR